MIVRNQEVKRESGSPPESKLQAVSPDLRAGAASVRNKLLRGGVSHDEGVSLVKEIEAKFRPPVRYWDGRPDIAEKLSNDCFSRTSHHREQSYTASAATACSRARTTAIIQDIARISFSMHEPVQEKPASGYDNHQ